MRNLFYAIVFDCCFRAMRKTFGQSYDDFYENENKKRDNTPKE